MSTQGHDDPESTPTTPSSNAPELDGLNPQDLLAAGLQSEPQMSRPPQAPDADATMPVSRPQPTQPPAAQVELPTPEEITLLLPGGNYHVESFLGQGGMGAVYRGTQVRLKRPVAIKIMRRDFGKDYDFEARFEREAQAMAKLNHPNIVSVIDYGEAGPDYLYIVMELVDGADLMDVIRTGRMTQEMALTLLPQICDALQFAHDHGIVHRDIKPSNIMLTRDGRIKMADFGLAKRTDVESSFRTQTGTGMGTPDYAAPEQFDAHAAIDHRADIYALGVMIYQMITGSLPRGVWKPPSQRAEIDPHWDDIVSRAMQSDPKDRYQQASEIKTDVSSIPLNEGRPAPAKPAAAMPVRQPKTAPAKPSAPPQSKSRARILVGVIGAVVAIGAGAFFAMKKSGSGGEPELHADQSPVHSPARATTSEKTDHLQTPPGTQWVDALAEWWAKNPDGKHQKGVDTLKREAGGSRKVGDMPVYVGNDITDVAVRVICKGGGPLWRLGVRASNGAYEASLDNNGKGAIKLTSLPSQVLGEFSLPNGFSLNDRHAAEFSVIGDELVFILDGREMARVRNKDKNWGAITFHPGPGGLIEKLEYLKLPMPASAVEASSAAQPDNFKGTAAPDGLPDGPWVDALAEWWAKNPDGKHQKGADVLKREGTGHRIVGTLPLYIGRSLHNTALRVTVRGGESEWYLNVRSVNGSYQATVQRNGKGNLRMTGSPSVTLASFELPAGFKFDDPHVAELRCFEDQITFIVDGKELARVRDQSKNWGDTTFQGKGVLIEKMEYLNPPQPTGEEVKRRIESTAGSSPSASPSDLSASQASAPTVAAATKDAPFVNSLGMKFVPVPGTKVLFSIWDTRVTDYSTYAAAMPGIDGSWKTRKKEGEADHPVVSVNWEEAQAFCQWLTEKETAAGTLPKGARYRLPTDAEWSTAVGLPPERGATPEEKRAASAPGFPWGPKWPPTAKDGNYGDPNMPEPDGFEFTSPVGSFRPNAFGLFDLGGNVWEWTADWWNATQTERALRGASFETYQPSILRSCHRDHYKPGDHMRNVGFRCVLEPAPETNVRLQPAGASGSSAAWTDALVLTDPAKHAQLGSKWERTANGLEWRAGPQGADVMIAGTVLLPVDLPPNYVIESEFTCGNDKGNYGILVPVGGDTMTTAWLDGPNATAGIGKIDGKDPWEKAAPGKSSSISLQAGRRYSLKVEVHREASAVDVRFWIDEKEVGSYHGPKERLSLSTLWWAGPDRTYVRLGANKPGTFHTARIKALTDRSGAGNAKPSADGTPATATKDSPFTNTLGMKFVPVPITGGPTGGKRVLFSTWETRVQDYGVFVKATGVAWRKPDFAQTPDHPAVNVSWNDAKAFAAWLTERERKAGRLGEAEVYRLPSDHEWSCAVGIGDREDPKAKPMDKIRRFADEYLWGATWPPPPGAGNYSGEETAGHQNSKNQPVLTGWRDGFPYTAPVGSFTPNRLGLHDLGGNALEFADGTLDEGGQSAIRRGGCFENGTAEWLLSSSRVSSEATLGGSRDSFRLVLAPAPSDPVKSAAVIPGTATKDTPFVNTLGMKFVPVPGTKVHFSIWDTRVMDYQKYAAAKPGVDGSWKTMQNDGVPVGREPDHPVVGVNWEDAQGFCAWLTEKETAAGTLPKGAKYRLPTDAEWSTAVGLPPEQGATPQEKNERGMSDVNFPWGKDYPPTKEAGNYADETFHSKFPPNGEKDLNPWMKGYTDGYATTSPVGAFPANGHGLYDMGGNVWQWCEDWWSAEHKNRVLRGASWFNHDRIRQRSSHRFTLTSATRYHCYGFRCVLEPAPAGK